MIRGLALLAMALGAMASAHATDPAGIDPKEYFEALDYVSPGGADRMMSYECLVRAIADATAARVQDDDTGAREAAALTQAYAALFMVNTHYALRDGSIRYGDLIRCGRLAEGEDARDEERARESLIERYLARAEEGLPGDLRVLGWKVGSRIRRETLDAGRPSREALEELVTLAEQDHRFNLFSGLIVTRDVSLPDDLLERLFAAAKRMTDKNGPCRLNPEKCRPGRKAPHASRAALVLLADTILEHAERTPDSQMDAATALFLYVSLRLNPEISDGIERWKPRGYVLERIKRARLVAHGRTPGKPDYWRSWPGVSVARCASCHSGWER